MDELNDESVHLIVTSPPYWQLKDYGSKEQIGYNDSYQDYINNLSLVWNQCFYGNRNFSGLQQSAHLTPTLEGRS
jgi:site-specific DNA-methyltransferase (adenine-specific)